MTSRRARIESLGVSPPGLPLPGWGSLRHAVRAGQRCLAASSYRPSDVDVLIYAGLYHDGHVVEPAFATYVQRELGVNVEFRGKPTLSFDLSGGTSVLTAFDVASAALESGQAGVALVVAGETGWGTPLLPGRLPPSGAAALLDLSPSSSLGLGRIVSRTYDEHAGLAEGVVALDRPGGTLRIQRRPGLERAYLAGAAEVVEAVLAEEGLRREDIDLVVPAQISPSLLAALPAAIGFAPRQVLSEAGLPDTLSTGVLLALDAARIQGRLATGQRALLLSFGAGVTVTGALLDP